jgi:hypothetical protein
MLTGGCSSSLEGRQLAYNLQVLAQRFHPVWTGEGKVAQCQQRFPILYTSIICLH